MRLGYVGHIEEQAVDGIRNWLKICTQLLLYPAWYPFNVMFLTLTKSSLTTTHEIIVLPPVNVFSLGLGPSMQRTLTPRPGTLPWEGFWVARVTSAVTPLSSSSNLRRDKLPYVSGSRNLFSAEEARRHLSVGCRGDACWRRGASLLM